MLRDISDTVRDLLAEYDQRDSNGGHENLPISVDVLKNIVQDRCGLKTLIVQEVDVKLPNVLGQIKFYYPVPKDVRTSESPTTAIIRIQKSLNLCWRRLVICKELCHCLIDTEARDRVTNTDDLITLFEGLASNLFFTESGCVRSERQAELLALELLYPYELRVTHLDDLKAGRITHHSLALRYRVPLEYAEMGMHDRHMALMASKFDKPKLRAVK